MTPLRSVFTVFAAALLGIGLIFTGAGRGSAQDATPVPGETPTGRPAHVHVGTCATLDPNPAFPLTDVVAPTGAPSGSVEAIQAETSFTTIAVDLATLLASDYAINVHLSAEEADVYVACGEIGGTALDQTGTLVIGLREQNDSGLTGVAYLTPNVADPAQTDVSVFLAADLSEDEAAGGGEDADATEEADDEAAATGGEVEVSLTEFVIDMPTTLPAGPTTFVITNDGTTEHNFEIENDDLGIEEELETNLAPGETGTLEIDLAPGTYEIYCPVGNHRDQGMELELTVE